MEDNFSTDQGLRWRGGWFGDDSSAVGFVLLCVSNMATDLTGGRGQMVM